MSNFLRCFNTFLNCSLAFLGFEFYQVYHSIYNLRLLDIVFTLTLEILHYLDYHECIFLVFIKCHLNIFFIIALLVILLLNIHNGNIILTFILSLYLSLSVYILLYISKLNVSLDNVNV